MSSPFRFGNNDGGGGRLPSPRHYFSRKFSNRIDTSDVSERLKFQSLDLSSLTKASLYVHASFVTNDLLLNHMQLVAIRKECARTLYTNRNILSVYAFAGSPSIPIYGANPTS